MSRESLLRRPRYVFEDLAGQHEIVLAQFPGGRIQQVEARLAIVESIPVIQLFASRSA